MTATYKGLEKGASRAAGMVCLAVVVAAWFVSPRALGQDWRELGPAPITNVNYAGRVSSIVCSPTDSNRYFIGGADGGVWRTTDGGASWVPLTDQMPTTAIGALALDPTDENIIYAGTGEANYANHSRYGLGLYKSTDGGDTWSQLAESVFGGRCFSKIVINHNNPQILYASITRAGGFPELAAAKNHPGAMGLLGVFKSTDGGATWAHLTGGLPNLSATDLAIDSVDPDVLYAAIGRIFGDSRNGIYKSTDGGASWTMLAGGLPTNNVGRTTVAVAPSNPNRVYALFVNRTTSRGGSATTLGAFRSDNGGATWTALPIGNIQATYGWYLSVISVKPDDPDTAFFGGLSMRRTMNAGTSFNTVTPPHVDQHALAWDASGRLLAGDDGGVHRTSNLGNTWFAINNTLGTIQFYAGLSTHPTDPTIIFGGTQDNGSNRRNTDSTAWTQVFGGDGGWTQVDQQNPLRVFVEFQGTGNLFRSTNGGNNFGSAGSGINRGDRNCFLPPFLINPADSNRMLYATHRVYRSLNGGSSWTAISGDLTDGAGAIRAIAQAPSDPDIVYVATNDGNVHVSFNQGQDFAQIVDEHSGWPRVTREIEVSEFDPARMYLAGAVFGVDQVLRTPDAGGVWEVLDGDLPDLPVNVIAENSRVSGQIFAGTDSGVFFTNDDGGHWERYGIGLPHAPVIDIRLDQQHGRIVISTQGRGVWSAPLRPVAADLTRLTMIDGEIISGGLARLRRSDDRSLETEARVTAEVAQPHLLRMQIDATADLENPNTIDLVFESKITDIEATVWLFLRDWDAGTLVQVDLFAVGMQESVHRTRIADAARFVRTGDGRIELVVKKVVFVPFTLSGFHSLIDHIEIALDRP